MYSRNQFKFLNKQQGALRHAHIVGRETRANAISTCIVG